MQVAERARDDGMNDLATVNVQSSGEPFVFKCIFRSEVGEAADIGKGRVAECERRGAWNGARHVSHAVVDDAVLGESRIVVTRRSARLEAAALVDGDVDDNGTRLHRAHHLPRD